jgi:hypothetical protein
MKCRPFGKTYSVGSHSLILRGAALLWLITVSPVQALTIPVFCDSTQVGNIVVNAVAGDGVAGGFTSTIGMPVSLAAAAAFCKEDHFNWFQLVTADNMPPVDAGGMRLTPPYVDPPSGGYGNDPTTGGDDTQWGDKLPWYWDEGPDPPAGTPGFTDGLNVNDNLSDPNGDGTNETLDYSDDPGGAIGTNLSFFTQLVSLNADGSLHRSDGGFTWDWTNATGTPTASNLQAIPEPSSIILFGIGLAYFAVRLARNRGQRQN